MRGKHAVQVTDTRFVSSLMNDVDVGLGVSTGRDIWTSLIMSKLLTFSLGSFRFIVGSCQVGIRSDWIGLQAAWKRARNCLLAGRFPAMYPVNFRTIFALGFVG